MQLQQNKGLKVQTPCSETKESFTAGRFYDLPDSPGFSRLVCLSYTSPDVFRQ